MRGRSGLGRRLVLGSLMALAAACGSRSGLLVGNDDTGAGGGGSTRPLADKIDLLFMIDNSDSMADKEALLAKAIPDLVARLINPLCIDADKKPAPNQPPTSTAPCPAGFAREFNPLQDMHLGIVTSSVGGHGADHCSPADPDFLASQDDHGRLVSRGPNKTTVSTYQGFGFLDWDPAATASPPGLGVESDLIGRFTAMTEGAGDTGCGAEAQLESWYRFLIDPDPYESMIRVDCEPGSGKLDCAAKNGIDKTLLAQRAEFLRPDSLVAIIMLTDENDCSIIDGADNFRVIEYLNPDGSLAYLPAATSACETNPNDPCCGPCDGVPAPGCYDPKTDPACFNGLQDTSLNLRCWQQRRRFGVDYLYPTDRYVHGLTELSVPDRNGNASVNPLLTSAKGERRDPSLVYLLGIVGVPWQDLAVDPFSSGPLVYKDAAELAAGGVWDLVLGDPEHETLPLDPLMIESVVPRSGVQPVTHVPLGPPDASDPAANPVNGHEFDNFLADELQYACVFDLPAPRDCSLVPNGEHCDCSADQFGNVPHSPVCQTAQGDYTTLQLRAKAYPGLRELEVLRDLGKNAVVASICARNVSDPSHDDYVYRPAIHALIDRLREGLR